MNDEGSTLPPENFPRLQKHASPSVIAQQALSRAAATLTATGLSTLTTGARKDPALDLLIADQLEAQALAHEKAADAGEEAELRRIWATRLRVRSVVLRSRA